MDFIEPPQSNVVLLTKEIVKTFKDSKSKPRDKITAKRTFDNQVRIENDYLEKSRICHTNGNNSLLGIGINNISGMHKDIIREKLKTIFFDITFMNEYRCAINTIIDVSDGDEKSERERIHNFIDNPKRFGEVSAYNFALKSDIKTGKNHDKFIGDMVVIKCPREPSSAKELIHELVVGVELSKLREYGCCGFSWVYDAFYCGPAIINDSTNEVINWCMNSKNPVSYVIYENIYNAIPLSEITKDKSENVASKTLKYLTQISLYLYLAELLCGFSHQDAHDDNILLRNYHDGEFFILCPFEDKEFYVPSPGAIATFIDYGMSRVVLNDGTSVGKLDSTDSMSKYAVLSNDGTVISDIHKILCFLLMKSIFEKNERLFVCLSGLLGGYFYGKVNMTVDEAQYLINMQFAERFNLFPDYVRSKGWNIVSFIKYLYEYSKHFFNLTVMHETLPKGSLVFGNFSPKTGKALSKGNDFYLDSDPIKMKNEIGLNSSNISTLFDLQQNPNNDKIKENVVNNMNEIIHNEKIEISSILNSKVYAGFIHLDTKKEDILKELEYAIHSIESVAIISNNCVVLFDKIKLYKSINNILNSSLLNDLISECQNKYNKDIKYIESVKYSLFENYKKIKVAMNGKIEDADNPLFNLYDKYAKTVDILLKIGVKI